TPWPVGTASVKPFSGRWHEAQEIRPLLLSLASEKRARPNAAAAGSSATRFEGSAGGGPRPSIERVRNTSSSSGDHIGVRAGVPIATNAASAAPSFHQVTGRG